MVWSRNFSSLDAVQSSFIHSFPSSQSGDSERRSWGFSFCDQITSVQPVVHQVTTGIKMRLHIRPDWPPVIGSPLCMQINTQVVSNRREAAMHFTCLFCRKLKRKRNKIRGHLVHPLPCSRQTKCLIIVGYSSRKISSFQCFPPSRCGAEFNCYNFVKAQTWTLIYSSNSPSNFHSCLRCCHLPTTHTQREAPVAC